MRRSPSRPAKIRRWPKKSKSNAESPLPQPISSLCSATRRVMSPSTHPECCRTPKARRSPPRATASSSIWTAPRSTTFPNWASTTSPSAFATSSPTQLISWTVLGQIRPQIGHVYGYRLEPDGDGTLVTSFYDWSEIGDQWREANIFPVISELALRATLGILDRTVRRGYSKG